MNGTVAVLGAVVVLGAAVAVVMVMRNNQAAPLAPPAAPSGMVISNGFVPPAVGAPAPAPTSSLVQTVSKVASTVGSVINTGKQIVDSISGFFKSFKL